MKRSKICGLLLVSFIMLGLSFVGCSGVSAIKYTVNSMPFYSFNSNIGETFTIRASNDIDPEQMYGQYVVTYAMENNRCVANSFQKYPIYQDRQDGFYDINYTFSGFNSIPSSWTSIDMCGSVDALQNYDSGSIDNLTLDFGLRDNLKSMLPYREKTSAMYLSDSYKDETNGLDFSNKFDLQMVFGSQGYPNKISRLTLPLGSPNSDVRSSLEAGQAIEFSGEIIIDADNPTNFGISDNTTIQLDSQYYTQNYVGSGSDFTDCSYTIEQENVDQSGIPVYSLKYSCPTFVNSNLDIDDLLLSYNLVINFEYTNSSNTKFSQFIFDSSFVITNHNETSGGAWGDDPVGSDTSSAPGSATQNFYGDISSDGVNWSSSLRNLFNFTFINPFAPLFNMFSDNNSCANIPTLAGMLHSNETQVCPWFDSSTRNIVTPVLGLFSMMLVFGFAVRWLGSSSGNFIEDSGGVDSGGYHFENKYRRKK